MTVVPIRPDLEPSPTVQRVANAVVRFRRSSRFAKWLWVLGALAGVVFCGWLAS